MKESVFRVVRPGMPSFSMAAPVLRYPDVSSPPASPNVMRIICPALPWLQLLKFIIIIETPAGIDENVQTVPDVVSWGVASVKPPEETKSSMP